MDHALKVAVLGCGRWGPCHARVFSRLPGSRLAGLADPDASRLKALKLIYPKVPRATNPGAVLGDPGVDCVVVATPIPTHYALVKEALGHGKHVLCEKPLCELGSQAEELVGLAKETGLVLMTGHVFLFDPALALLKRLTAAGELGRLRLLSSVRVNLGPVRREASVLLELASHDAAVFNWLLGAVPERVSARGACVVRKGVEDVLLLSMEYPNGAAALAQSSWLGPDSLKRMTAAGERRSALWEDEGKRSRLSLWSPGLAETRQAEGHDELLRMRRLEAEHLLPKTGRQEPLMSQGLRFLKAVRSGMATDEESGLAAGVVRTLEAAQRSLELGGRAVALP